MARPAAPVFGCEGVRVRRILLCCAAWAVVAPLAGAPAETRHVPEEYATIQAAIDAALPGDEVVLADGRYTGSGNRDLDLAGRAITVRSACGDPAACIIDCEHNGRGFFFHSGETGASIIRDLAICNGYADAGSGVCCEQSSPTLVNCLITGNHCTYAGGGLYCFEANPTVFACTIQNNTSEYKGGGVCGFSCSAVLAACTIAGNSAFFGGGVFCDYADLALADCVIAGNAAEANAGGIGCFDYCAATLTRCTVTENVAAKGGGVYCAEYSHPALYGCIITANATHTYSGAGVRCETASNAAVFNCLIAGNVAVEDGGGVSCYNSCPTLVNCAIRANSGVQGGGVHCDYYSSPELANCTVAGNTAETGGGLAARNGSTPVLTSCLLWGDAPQEIHLDSAEATLSWCDVQGGWAGEGNLDADPLFVDASAGDLRLAGGSPCIDAGDPACAPAPGAVDLDARLRLWDGDEDGSAVVDVGAYEYGAHAYGDLNCDGARDVFDIDPFVTALTDPAAYEILHPDCALLLADLNADGAVDGFDIEPFVAALVR